MPIDTKKMTANASRNGTRSAPICVLNGDSFTTTPATNAPSASDTPKSADETSAVPTAIVSTSSTNSSRERVCTMRPSRKGMMRPPTISIPSTNNAALPIANAATTQLDFVAGAATTGSNTRMATVSRSSKTSQPTASFP
jgi:hypothetical protein